MGSPRAEAEHLIQRLLNEALYVYQQNSYGRDTLGPLLRNAAESIGALLAERAPGWQEALNELDEAILGFNMESLGATGLKLIAARNKFAALLDPPSAGGAARP